MFSVRDAPQRSSSTTRDATCRSRLFCLFFLHVHWEEFLPCRRIMLIKKRHHLLHPFACGWSGKRCQWASLLSASKKLCRPEKEEEVCSPHTHFLCLRTSKLVQNWSPVQLKQTFPMFVRLLGVRPHGPAMRCREQRHLERKESSIDHPHHHTDTQTHTLLPVWQ